MLECTVTQNSHVDQTFTLSLPIPVVDECPRHAKIRVANTLPLIVHLSFRPLIISPTVCGLNARKDDNKRWQYSILCFVSYTIITQMYKSHIHRKFLFKTRNLRYVQFVLLTNIAKSETTVDIILPKREQISTQNKNPEWVETRYA